MKITKRIAQVKEQISKATIGQRTTLMKRLQHLEGLRRKKYGK